RRLGQGGRIARIPTTVRTPPGLVPPRLTFLHSDGRFGHWRDKDMPMLDGLKRISTALGLVAATATAAQAQAPAVSFNQTTANAVADALRSSTNLSPYRIEIETQAGKVNLCGTVSTPAEKAEALRLVLRTPGVMKVVDHLKVNKDARVRPAQ